MIERWNEKSQRSEKFGMHDLCQKNGGRTAEENFLSAPNPNFLPEFPHVKLLTDPNAFIGITTTACSGDDSFSEHIEWDFQSKQAPMTVTDTRSNLQIEREHGGHSEAKARTEEETGKKEFSSPLSGFFSYDPPPCSSPAVADRSEISNGSDDKWFGN